MDLIALFAILVSLLIIGFLSGIEIAFLSANKISIELSKKQGTQAGKTWSFFADRPARFLGTVLVAGNVLLVIYGLLVGDMLFPIWKWIEHHLPAASGNYIKYIKLLVETILSTLIIVIVEFFSRAYFRAKNNSVLNMGIITYAARFFYWLFSSAATSFVNISEWILKTVFDVKLRNKQEIFSKLDIEQFMIQNKNTPGEEEQSEINKELFENALTLKDVKLRECLIPRNEIISIQKNTSPEDARKRFIETGLSKLVVYDQDVDSIIGYIHQLDLFKKPASILEVLLPIPMVPESMSATDLMTRFSTQRKSIAWVIDEFGGTAGIVTMEDLLEEIFGDIKDEYDDVDDLVEKQISTNEYIFSGRMKLDHITEKYGLHFSNDENTETLSGYVIQQHGEIPQENERISIDRYEFQILSVSNTRIETIKLRVQQ